MIEIPGMMVSILAPPLNYPPSRGSAGAPVEIRGIVTLMCGCHVGVEPWPATD
jgi:hypothetical protein